MGIEGTRYEELSLEVLTELALVYSDCLVMCTESAAMNDGDENEEYRDLRRELRIQLIEMMVRVGMHEVAATRTMNGVIEMVASGAFVPGSSRRTVQ